MDRKRFERLQSLFLQACDLAEAPDWAWVKSKCDGDDELAEELAAMLLQHERVESPLDGIALDDADMREALGVPGPKLPGVDGYELLREVDRGGQSVVYEAIQTSTGQRVALKVLLNLEFSSEEERGRQSREVEVLAKLSHPNIVGVIDRGRTATGVDYVAMPFVDGCPLNEHLDSIAHESGGKIDVEAVLKLFIKIARAVGIAHRAGVVHRDLKPANIFVDKHGEPRVLDFGLARVMPQHAGSQDATVANVTLQGQFLGSLPWASPEQASGDPHASRPSTDVYALGVILYQMITGGRFPYEVIGNFRDVLDNILNARPKPPSSVKGELPTAAKSGPKSKPPGVRRVLDSVVLMSLAKNQADRYQDADAFADDVVRYLQGQPTKATPVSGVSTWELVAAWAQRKPGEARLAVACLALILFSALGAAVAAGLYQRQASLAAAAEAAARRAAAASLAGEAQSDCESGLLTPGLHKLSRALTYAYGAGDDQLEESVRLNLEAWGRQLPRVLHVLPHPGADVTSAVIRPQGDLIATAADDGSVKVWRSEDGQLASVLPTRGSAVMSLTWSPDGLELAVQGRDGFVDLVDIQSGSTNSRIRYSDHELADFHALIYAGIQYAPDGESIYVAGGGNLSKYSVSTGEAMEIAGLYHDEYCVDFALSPDGDKLLQATLGWNLNVVPKTRTTARPLRIRTLESNTCLSLFPDGRHAVTGHNIGENLQVWNLKTGKAVGDPLAIDGKPRDCAVSPDGKRLACVGESPFLFVYDVGLFELRSGRRREPRRIYLGEQADFVAFGPAGDWVLVETGEHVSMWQVDTGGPLWRSRTLPALVQCRDIHPNRSEIAVGLWARGSNPRAARYLHRFDLDSGEELQPRIDAAYLDSDFVDDLHYNPASDVLYACRAGRIAAWEIDSGELVARLDTEGGQFSELDVSEDGQHLLASQRYGPGGKALVWDTSKDGWTTPITSLAGPIMTIATHPSEQLFCAVSKDSAVIRGYTDAIEQRSLALEEDSVATAVFSPDGKSLLFGCQNRSIRLRGLGPKDDRNVAVATARDNHFIATDDSGDLVITGDFSHRTEIWHMPSARKIGPTINGGKPIGCPDGKSVIVAREGVELERWPIPTPTLLDPGEVTLWVEKATGTTMTSRGVVQSINADRWLENPTDVFAIGGAAPPISPGRTIIPPADRAPRRHAEEATNLREAPKAGFMPRTAPPLVPTPRLQADPKQREGAEESDEMHSILVEPAYKAPFDELTAQGKFLDAANRLRADDISQWRELVRAAKQAPDDRDSRPLDWMLIGELRAVGGQYAEAEAAILKAFHQGENRPFVHKALGWVRLMGQRPEEARSSLQTALSRFEAEDEDYDLTNADVDSLTAAYLLGIISADAFTASQQTTPFPAFPWFYIGQLRESQDEIAGAIRAYETASSLGEPTGPNGRLRAWARVRLEDLQRINKEKPVSDSGEE